MEKLVFKTMYNTSPDRGEELSNEIVTEEGQAFSTREIYVRFLRTGRVEGMARNVVYDSDELGREPKFEDYDVTQDGSFDLSDASSHNLELAISSKQKESINNLSALYATGKISFDEFCSNANKINADYARPFIDKFGKALAKNTHDREESKQSE